MKFKEFLTESTNVTIEIDLGFAAPDFASDKKIAKKYKLTFGKPRRSSSGSPSLELDVTGSKKDLIAFLKKEYGDDEDDIKEYYPELYK